MDTLRESVRHLLQAVRREEWTYHRALTDEQRESDIRTLVTRASEARRYATDMLQAVAEGRPTDGCVAPEPGPVGDWAHTHHQAHEAMTALHAALDATTEEQLAADVGPRRNHPQYLWRDVTNLAVRGPFLSYAQWFETRCFETQGFETQGRHEAGLAVLARWYEAVRGAMELPTKALSDVSYDLACGLSRAGRLDEAMQYLPDAFTYNDRGAVGVLKAWAREDGDLAPLSGRADFQTLVGGPART
jgi:hypothetical protein